MPGMRGLGGEAPPAPAQAANGDAGVMLQFPLNGVSDILSVYERLTQKTVLRDTSILEGPQVSLVTAVEVPREEAIRLIEATLTLNGYVIVDEGDGKTLKVLLGRAAGQPPGGINGGSGVYTEEKGLPDGDLLVSYFLRLENLTPSDAAVIMANHLQMNSYGRITPVESPAGLLITESAGIVRKLLRLKELIDVPPGESKLMTQFVKLEFADANTVAQIIQATMDARYEEKQRVAQAGKSISSTSPAPPVPAPAPESSKSSSSRAVAARKGGVTAAAGVIGTEEEPAAQLVADDRLNRIFVQASTSDFAFILELIRDFDQPLPDEKPLEQVLNYVKVADVLPVIVDVLTDKGSGKTQLPGGRSLDTRQAPASSTSLASLAGVQTKQQQQRFQQQTSTSTDTANGGQPADRLSFPVDDVAPVSVLVGKTRIIADRQSNTILVIGSREAKQVVVNLLEKLDRKPPQVFLAVVIGQLTLGQTENFGTEWPSLIVNARGWSEGYKTGSVLGKPGMETSYALNSSIANSLSPTALANAIGKSTRLNLYGTIGTQLSVVVNALETTNRFKVLSRPVLSVQNNKKASITSGQKIPVPQSTLGNAGGSGIVSLQTTIGFQNVVLKLEMIPQVNENDEVTLEIAQVNDTQQGSLTVSGNEIPIIGTQELTTTVNVPNRQTIVLGGIISEKATHDGQGVPVVSRIPVLGEAFKNNSKNVQRDELLIFIQPVVARSHQAQADASFDEDLRADVGADAADAFPSPGKPTKSFEEEQARAAQAAQPMQTGTKPAKKPGLFRSIFGGVGESGTAEEAGLKRKLFQGSER